MKEIIKRFAGVDKAAHFGIGGLITAIFTIVFIMQDMGSLIFTPWRMLLYPFIGTAVTAIVSVAKEMLWDEQPDWYDLYAALIGSATIFVATFFGIVFFVGTSNLV
jgi:hypothetical protein